MVVQSFTIRLLVCGSFFSLAICDDIGTLSQALDDIKDREGVVAADMTLERTTGIEGGLTTTKNRGHEATDWEDDTMLEAQEMLADLDAIAEDVQQGTPQIRYKVVGCYKDKQLDPRPLLELLADLTGEIDWHDLNKVIQKCAKLARDQGYTYFGFQSFGRCRSGKDAASTYNRDGLSNGCKSGLGGQGENLVFTIILSQSTTQLPTEKPTTIIPTGGVTLLAECQNYLTLNSIRRSMNFNDSVSSCDDKLARGWYRFEGSAGNRMPTSCVSTHHCGAHAPGWLVGPHPAVHEGKVRSDVCFHWKSCCSWRNSVLVRNCGSFFVYGLSPTITCNLRYCGNGQEVTTSSPTTTPSSTTSTTTTTTPTTVTTTSPETTTLTSTTEKSTSSTKPPTPTAPECLKYMLLDSADRSMDFKTDVPKDLAKCDTSLQDGWYRFQGDAGDRMPTSCIDKLRCGTHAPGWLSGIPPTVSQGAMRSKVCFHWGGSCCRFSKYIRVRNCSGFYVYQLNKPRLCKLRYCGNGVQEPTTIPPAPSTFKSTQRSTASSTSTQRLTSPTSPLTPPECLNYKLLKEANRAEGHSTINRTAICDRALAKGWYRFFGDAGDKMPEFCVPKLRCGTHAPGWLETGHPSVADGIVNARVCFHWGTNCCYWSADIRVRNCGPFFVYQLHRVPFCSLRYCGNNRVVPILTTTPPPITSKPTTYTLPMECSTYKVFSGRDRSQTYKYKSVQGAKPTCDRWLAKAWYRFSGLAGDRMPEKCVPIRRCGTLAPGWLQGAHPSVNNGVVSRTVCFNWANKCCRWNRRILVRNCGDFYIYNLQRAPVCKLRYCGVGEIATPKPATTPKATTTSTPTTPPFPTEPKYGFAILCLPSAMHVRISKQRLPSFVSPDLLRLDDPSCGVAKMDENDVILTTTLDGCGTIRRTEDDRVSFHNKIVAESSVRRKRSVFEFPFTCSYKKLSLLGNQFEPIHQRGQVMDSTFDLGE